MNKKQEQQILDYYSSFKEQEIGKEPTVHIGAVANALERKGIKEP